MAENTTWTEDLYEVDVSKNIHPAEFKDCKPLSTSEVKFLLEQHSKECGDDEIEELQEAFEKTLAFVQATSKFSSKKACDAAREKLKAAGIFSDFDIAHMLNVCPQDAEEAFTLMPTLQGRIETDALDRLLEDVNQHRDCKSARRPKENKK